MWRCRTGAAGDCRAWPRGGCFFPRTRDSLPSTTLFHDGRGLPLETFAAGGPARVEPAVLAAVDDHRHDRPAVLGAAQTGYVVEAAAQALAERRASAILDRDLHRDCRLRGGRHGRSPTGEPASPSAMPRLAHSERTWEAKRGESRCSDLVQRD